MRKYTLLILLMVVACAACLFIGLSIQSWFDPLHNLQTRCEKEESAYTRGKCLEPFFSLLTLKTSASQALADAVALQKEGVIDDCHLAAHVIGEANVQKYDGDIGKAFATCPQGCIEGCYHGVMEVYVAQVRSLHEVVEEASSLCKEVGTTTLHRRQCLHGIGHGLVLHNTNGVMRAVELCSSLKEVDEQTVCLGGVFMENMNAYLSVSGEELKSTILNVCAAVRENRLDLLPMCLSTVGEGLMFYTGHDVEKSKSFCEVLEKDEKDECVRGVEIEAQTHERNMHE